MGVNKTELTLVRAVQNNGDSLALEALVAKYQPMIQATIKRFYLRMFDQDDWQQEARIVCYETCLLYETQRNCQFGAFYKLRFDHHVRNLVRHELAVKRQSNRNNFSLEEMLISETFPGFTVPAERESRALPAFDLAAYLTTLSNFEFQSFQVILNLRASADVCHEYDCDQLQVKRAIARCKKKLQLYLATC
ncbi:sigma-70 RNA polymerase sigma factor region 4 domain-containing protein [Lapidilactobacillus bayanensis]|uniref:sigma-70 family RNA polymerase sigma factor n=1 Tax=Lapidilactobacillus bayanensis TaxID=2485998 RepID=UPI000F766535|nr:sigma-70 family RNA polymerase sigma factor [Lapidilactobacillus bayanensis]